MSRNRDRGTKWETAIVNHLREQGVTHADRAPLRGTKDTGDITGIPGLVIEAKMCFQAEWGAHLNEAEREAARVDPPALGILWTHRRGHAHPRHGYVVMSGHTFTALLRQAGYIPAPDGDPQ